MPWRYATAPAVGPASPWGSPGSAAITVNSWRIRIRCDLEWATRTLRGTAGVNGKSKHVGDAVGQGTVPYLPRWPQAYVLWESCLVPPGELSCWRIPYFTPWWIVHFFCPWFYLHHRWGLVWMVTTARWKLFIIYRTALHHCNEPFCRQNSQEQPPRTHGACLGKTQGFPDT